MNVQNYIIFFVCNCNSIRLGCGSGPRPSLNPLLFRLKAWPQEISSLSSWKPSLSRAVTSLDLIRFSLSDQNCSKIWPYHSHLGSKKFWADSEQIHSDLLRSDQNLLRIPASQQRPLHAYNWIMRNVLMCLLTAKRCSRQALMRCVHSMRKQTKTTFFVWGACATKDRDQQRRLRAWHGDCYMEKRGLYEKHWVYYHLDKCWVGVWGL